MNEQVFTGCTQGGPVMVHVADGRIIRIRPLAFGDHENIPTWKIRASGRTFEAPRRVTLAPYVLAQRARTYSSSRLRYPLQRVDFDPGGERNPQNRGRSGYRRISWDEALDTVAEEVKRVRSQFGPEAIASRCSSHHEWGDIGYKFGAWGRFFNLLGFTDVFDNPDSWEGWLWGAAHAYGFWWRLGVPEQNDLLEDTLQNSELIIYWSNDPDSTFGVYGGQESAVWRIWLKETGKNQIFIDPYCNASATWLGGKWLAPRPGTDAALAEGIAHVWLSEGTYDRAYLESHTVGFEKFRDYILGREDGIPKDPCLASKRSGIPASTIKALARQWASSRTSLAAGTRGGFGGACREAYGTEWPRLALLLQAMQGLGKPGVNIWGATTGAPYNNDFKFPGYCSYGWGLNPLSKKQAVNPVSQRIYRLLLPEAVLNPPVSWLSEGFCGSSLEQQYVPYRYPEPGKSPIRMFYRYGGSYVGTMTETGRYVRMYQSPELEMVVNQDVWWNTETGLADIILPACTNFERNDIAEWANSGGYADNSSDVCNHRIIVYQQKCIEPLYESRSDYWILTQLADRLGFKDEFTDGTSGEEEWIERLFYATDLPRYTTFDEFKKKGYFVVPLPEPYQSRPAFRWFYEGRDCDTGDNNPLKNTPKAKRLGTLSGKIEFVSQSLSRQFPEDGERPPLPRYIPSWEGHESKEITVRYPLQMISPHPRFSFHTHHDTGNPWLDEIPDHRVLKDGHYWRTVRIHPLDAAPRRIKNRDIIKLFNDRGAVLGIATVTERIRPGVVHCYESSGIYDPLEKGNSYSPDRGGCVNILAPSRMISQNAPGMANNSCLVQVEKWES
ncbi:MAG: molybdopterin-dependent oxidoreductase [Dehalococcoidales bacterium]|nr:molybdopterin-dependent oxidoreductase [Dehalococcoidales bacterium]